MILPFFKFHGTGNDFIIIDNREFLFERDNYKLIKKLCHRRFGIGSDGLMLLQNDPASDFEMIYYNADGKEGSMCGNGGRCIVAFAKMLGLVEKEAKFNAADGLHTAIIIKTHSSEHYSIKLKMQDVKEIEEYPDYYFIDTGSPHYVCFRKNIDLINVVEEGRRIRYSEPFGTIGTNVNFVEAQNNSLCMRTYERGVEDETLSCGTGAVASALVAVHSKKIENKGHTEILSGGGKLRVHYSMVEKKFENIWLEGDAVCVFKGEVNV